MHTAFISDFKEWREKAREFLYADIHPNQVIWHDTQLGQQDLFTQLTSTEPVVISAKKYAVTAEFLELAEIVACHCDVMKWQKLYKALWRITHGEKNLLAISSDPLIHDLQLYAKAVRRDSHKMKAFVRFRQYQEQDKTFFLAWHEPDHNIIRRIAPFFKRRFAVMQWIIITPFETVAWDGERLQFFPGVKQFKHAQEDDLETLWRTYYRAIFNPARIKIKAMKNEMPVRYWKNLPETQIIHDMLAEAPARVSQMLSYSEGIAASASDYFPAEMSHEQLQIAAAHCQACPLHQCGQQAVFGSGPLQAAMMIVNDNPMKDDAQTRHLIDETLKNLNIEMNQPYFTHAIKHPKHKMVDAVEVAHTPTIQEIHACKPWLAAEIALIQPTVIVCLGLVAARAVISGGFHFKQLRGTVQYYQAVPVIVTHHPKSILSKSNQALQATLKQEFEDDFAKAVNLQSAKQHDLVPSLSS